MTETTRERRQRDYDDALDAVRTVAQHTVSRVVLAVGIIWLLVHLAFGAAYGRWHREACEMSVELPFSGLMQPVKTCRDVVQS